VSKEQIRVKVIFRVFRGEVIALFPEIPGTGEPHTCNSYMHVGQHSSADYAGVIESSRAAEKREYADLAAELRRIGYVLDIKTRDAGAAMAKTRRAELERDHLDDD
jgi:hypothetical protein